MEEAGVKADLLKDELADKLADGKDKVAAAADNAKQAALDKVENLAVQADLAKDELKDKLKKD